MGTTVPAPDLTRCPPFLLALVGAGSELEVEDGFESSELSSSESPLELEELGEPGSPEELGLPAGEDEPPPVCTDTNPSPSMSICMAKPRA